MYKLYKIVETSKRDQFILITTGSRGRLGTLMNQLSQTRDPHAMFDPTDRLVSRSW